PFTSVTPNNSTEMEIDEQNTPASVLSQIESAPATVIKSWANEVNNIETITRPNTPSTIERDIRKINPLDKHFKILEFCRE
ncbi:43_t:CDS:1, partial [Acaulospora morrowiae]